VEAALARATCKEMEKEGVSWIREEDKRGGEKPNTSLAKLERSSWVSNLSDQLEFFSS